MAQTETTSMEKIVSLCKRRGFVFQASEIYGGIGNTYDYGPLGVELLRRVKDAWWTRVVVEPATTWSGWTRAIIQNPQTCGHLSGHVGGLQRSADRLQEVQGPLPGRQAGGRAPVPRSPRRCRGECDGRADRAARLQPDVQDQHRAGGAPTGSVAYLRPETAQGIFLNFQNVMNSARIKPPFGIAQIGKSFRNEITPGNFVFRTREFEQAEMEFFVPPDQNDQWYEFWKKRASTGTRSSASTVEAAHARPRRRTSWPTTPPPPATSSTSTPSDGASSRGSPAVPTST